MTPKTPVFVKHATTPTQRFLLGHEARVLRTLHGIDGIPQIDQVPTNLDAPEALCLQYLEGAETLDVAVKGLSQCQDIVDWISHQSRGILAQVHVRGWVHGDIRPQNIMVRNLGSPNAALFIIDWEASSRRGQVPDRSLPRQFSLGYSHPEVIFGHAPASPKWDFYGLEKTMQQVQQLISIDRSFVPN